MTPWAADCTSGPVRRTWTLAAVTAPLREILVEGDEGLRFKSDRGGELDRVGYAQSAREGGGVQHGVDQFRRQATALTGGAVKAMPAPVVRAAVDISDGPGRERTVCGMRGL